MSSKTKKEHFDTELVVDHFPSFEYLKLIYKSDLLYIKQEIKINLLTSFIVMSLAFILLLLTFQFLDQPILSLIPVMLLFFFSAGIIFTILNNMKYNVINRLINGELQIDRQYLCLYIMKYLYEEQDFNDNESEHLSLRSFDGLNIEMKDLAEEVFKENLNIVRNNTSEEKQDN